MLALASVVANPLPVYDKNVIVNLNLADMRKFGVIFALVMIGIGIIGMAISEGSTESGYWLGALIVGVLWLISDIIVIKKYNRKK